MCFTLYRFKKKLLKKLYCLPIFILNFNKMKVNFYKVLYIESDRAIARDYIACHVNNHNYINSVILVKLHAGFQNLSMMRIKFVYFFLLQICPTLFHTPPCQEGGGKKADISTGRVISDDHNETFKY